jgi:hypothetical protein
LSDLVSDNYYPAGKPVENSMYCGLNKLLVAKNASVVAADIGYGQPFCRN